DDLFTPMAERLMISGFRPVWNPVLDGFGVNRQGGPREAEQMRPAWHELHRGVPSFEVMQQHNVPANVLATRVSDHLARYSQPAPDAAIPGQATLRDDQFDSQPLLISDDELGISDDRQDAEE